MLVLGKSALGGGEPSSVKPYPLQITMYHPLPMHVYQSLGSAPKLSGEISSVTVTVSRGIKSYEFKPIHIPVRSDKRVDGSTHHPFGYHFEATVAHCRSQQREHVRVAETLPCYNLFAESLQNQSVLPLHTFGQPWAGPTFIILARLLVKYTLRTLTATLRP